MKSFFKVLIATVVAGTGLFLCPKEVAASVDIIAGGAGILDPLSIYSEYAGYIDDIYVVNFAKKAEEEIEDIPGRIRDGIYIGDVNVSGMTYKQALNAVDNYVSDLSQKKITLDSIADKRITYTMEDMGLSWLNKDAVINAISIGKGQNIIAQYKTICDLKQEPKIFDLELGLDRDMVTRIVDAEAEASNVRPKNADIDRVDGKFIITGQGMDGMEINVAKSVSDIIDSISDWDKEDIVIDLTTNVVESDIDEEDLSVMTDILGSYTTSYKTSSADRSGNVKTGCKHINGKVLHPGEQLSVYEAVSPFTEENGYFMAGSYLNGMVVESLGGGICQVSSTLYNAVIRAELQVDERSSHSMVVTYVDLSSDAAIAGTYKDFKFTNNTDYPIYIEGFTTDEKKITFNIYGKDERPKNRVVEFESVQTSKTEPEGDDIIRDPSKPIGFISTQSAHIGYTGELWKIVKVDGVETDRVRINKSTYLPSKRTATVGIASSDANIIATLDAAIATGNIDYVKQTIASLTAIAQAAAVPVQ